MSYAGIFRDIAPSRFADGKLWGSNLDIDHLSRYYGSYGVTCNHGLPTQTLVAPGTLQARLHWIFPDFWGDDETFLDMELAIGLMVELVITGGIGNQQDGGVTIDGSIVTRDLRNGRRYLRKKFNAPFPTGPYSENVTLTWTGSAGVEASTISMQKTAPYDGCTMYWGLMAKADDQ